jgi:XisH protein
MPRPDIYHNQVKAALIKDGWMITDDPFTIEFRGTFLYADLGAEKLLAAQKQNFKIVVEIKSFQSPSLMSELEKAVGQYGIYRTFIKRIAPDRSLYMAVSQAVYQDFFQRPAICEVIADHQINLLIFEPTSEEVIQWIS